ncbi:MAG: MaoC family dehydratase [Planctomycetia bacterium]|nr:MaoC family dehydratase [Planctomycetia bacterium]
MRTIQGVEELRSLVGQELGASDWIDVKQEMISAFSDITRDKQWIHTDLERAKRESPFRTTIAHGFLTLSLVSYLHGQAVRIEGDHKMGINYGLNRVRFPNPVRSGSRIRSRSFVKAVEDFPEGAQITWLITVELENAEKPALVAEWVTRLYR